MYLTKANKPSVHIKLTFNFWYTGIKAIEKWGGFFVTYCLHPVLRPSQGIRLYQFLVGQIPSLLPCSNILSFGAKRRTGTCFEIAVTQVWSKLVSMLLNIHSQNFMCTFKHNAKLFKALFWELHYTLRTDLPLCVFTRCQMPHTYFNYRTTDVQISPCWGVGGGVSNTPGVCLWECGYMFLIDWCIS